MWSIANRMGTRLGTVETQKHANPNVEAGSSLSCPFHALFSLSADINTSLFLMRKLVFNDCCAYSH